jgi:hypothetical protein
MAARGDFKMPWFAPNAEVLRSDQNSATFRGFLYRVLEDSCDGCDDRYVPMAPSNVRFGFTVMGKVDRPPVFKLLIAGPPEGAVPGTRLSAVLSVIDADTVTRMTFDFVTSQGAVIRIGELQSGSTPPPNSFLVPCLGPTATSGELLVTAYDEHGHTDQSSSSVPYTILGGPCSAPLSTFRAGPSPFASALDVFAPGAGEVRVHDATGRLVRGIPTSGGNVHWDGRDDRGTAAGAGVYWIRFKGAAGEATKRVVKLGR